MSQAPHNDCPSGSPRWRQALRRRVLAWYAKHQRDLPWRRSGDPYAVWVSEIMLQQTQVATVIAYFERFIAELPTVEALAGAPEDQVLRLWEGLGYYRRARHLQQAARQIVQRHGGQLPADQRALEALPGIGRYTAAAIVSIAFGRRAAVLEANTRRLLRRLFAAHPDLGDGGNERLLWQLADLLVPRRDPGTFNQAMMELGSRLCKPRDPHCPDCPLQTLCQARQLGLEQTVPGRRRRAPPEEVHESVVIIQRRGRLLVRRCPERHRWGGLWDFLRLAVDGRSERQRQRRLVDAVAELTGLQVRLGPPWKTLHHTVTRFRITLCCYRAEQVTGSTRRNGRQLRWVRPAELDQLPLNATARRLARMLQQKNPPVG